MTQRTVATLAALAVGLVLLLVGVRNVDIGGPRVATGRLLLPEFAPLANDIGEVRIAGAGEGVTLRREDDGWVVVERDGYPADMGKLRPLVIALSEATIVEEKTSNPELYARLGLGDPDGDADTEGGADTEGDTDTEGDADPDGIIDPEGDTAADSDTGTEGNGTAVTVSGEGVQSTVIFGNTAQGDNRYARVADEPGSYLVDVNPELPQSPGEWLDPQITDIAADTVRLVTIEHADGERIELARPDDAETPDYVALNLPEGRELTYPSVANGIAGALDDLDLEDVRQRGEGEAGTTTVFATADGLEVSVELIEEGNEEETSDAATWLRFSAKANGEEAQAAADALNERLGKREYRVADFKTQLLTKRWDDLLKAPPE